MKRVSLVLWLLCTGALAEHHEIINYKAYSDTLASAGQPTEAQVRTLAADGLKQIVYVAWSDHDNSLQHADRLAKSLGVRYVHIPIDWNAPTRTDYALVAAALEQSAGEKTLLHCQMNFRASSLAMLYRVLQQGVPLAEAKADMNAVWQPNQVWTDFMRDILAENGVDPDCDGCDWTVPVAD